VWDVEHQFEANPMLSSEMINGHRFTVRNMQRDDLRNVYEWSIAEGWNIGKYDHDVFFATDPNGFFLGEIDGIPIGSVSGVAYDESFGFIGLYIVQKEYRGKGYGLKIFNEAMRYLGGRCVGLDAVLEQQENYKLSGFKFAYRNIRFQWTPPADLPISPKLVPAQSVPFELLSEFDARHFPARRDAFLRSWISEPQSTALAVESNGALTAFGMIRAFDNGYSIGPLFAETPELAQSMFHALSAHQPGESVFLDVPQVNTDALNLAKNHGMTQVFETARMYTGQIKALPLANIYGVTSFELG
jgi:GNAT superfamily N-acetyltransferase